jgi:hypothetical protein
MGHSKPSQTCCSRPTYGLSTRGNRRIYLRITLKWCYILLCFRISGNKYGTNLESILGRQELSSHQLRDEKPIQRHSAFSSYVNTRNDYKAVPFLPSQITENPIHATSPLSGEGPCLDGSDTKSELFKHKTVASCFPARRIPLLHYSSHRFHYI